MDEGDKRGWRFEDGGFLALVLLVSLAFIWLVLPFFGAILWGLVAAILFAPLNRWLVRRMGGHENVAAALVLLLIVTLVILPAFLLGMSLVREAASLYVRIEEGDLDLAQILVNLRAGLPDWARGWLDQYGLTDLEQAREMVGNSLATILQAIGSRALLFGQGALRLFAALGVMLYLTFFLLRDGERLGAQVKTAVPLRQDLRDALVERFIVVIRATMKGTVVVAAVQGFVGGMIFWMLGLEGPLLWGLLMAFFSLVPAVGAGIVWLPVAIYLLVTGSYFEGIALTLCGFFIISLIDNVLRPILVGKDTRMPDFVVLIATLSGLDLFGLNGFIVGPMIAALFISVWNIVSDWRRKQAVRSPA
ncbi:AI-2E family transporter [Novosphingobium marinum]|uniref:Putative PurR-regulated permease PerM n=1 Tax=Novosphingobium marinum TaxID=1514948 RepID=A0A7Y9Y0W7_9SPHN|nr:AI-2E family transporter [Novosphingobium marinum]NYH96938.1 putative PurR-regulated permease PerM [Novosphingobium marinum]GGC42209.1 AI-2E family transporter [Novosphingobium marinum]